MQLRLDEEDVQFLVRARKEIDRVDTDAYHGIGQIEALEAKMEKVTEFLDVLMGAFGIGRCEKCGAELIPYERQEYDDPDDEPSTFCPKC